MRIVKFISAGLLGLFAFGAAAQADVLDDIKKRGTLIVGVKADYKPFGFRDPSGGIIGLEPDLAADVAKKLGVKLELIPVVSANRMEFLNQGKIDLMIATMSDKAERRKIVQVIEPLYYSDAVNVLLKKGSPVKSWEDLKGKKLCGTTGAFYNKDVAQQYAPRSPPSTAPRSRCWPSRTATASATSMTRPSSPASCSMTTGRAAMRWCCPASWRRPGPWP